jgi:hypothetical protein
MLRNPGSPVKNLPWQCVRPTGLCLVREPLSSSVFIESGGRERQLRVVRKRDL